MKNKLNNQINELDMLIRGWERVVNLHPSCQSYQDALAEAKKKRALIAAQIGKQAYVKRVVSK